VIYASVKVESALSEFFSYKWVATEFYLVCKCVTTEFYLVSMWVANEISQL
jgi:hypothetical protein